MDSYRDLDIPGYIPAYYFNFCMSLSGKVNDWSPSSAPEDEEPLTSLQEEWNKIKKEAPDLPIPNFIPLDNRLPQRKVVGKMTLHVGTDDEMKEEAKIIVHSLFLRMQMMTSKFSGHQKRKNKELFDRIKELERTVYRVLDTSKEEKVVDYVIRISGAAVVVEGMIKEMQSYYY